MVVRWVIVRVAEKVVATAAATVEMWGNEMAVTMDDMTAEMKVVRKEYEKVVQKDDRLVVGLVAC
jgi:hypothetical protein